jgi:hypothetical protein
MTQQEGKQLEEDVEAVDPWPHYYLIIHFFVYFWMK